MLPDARPLTRPLPGAVVVNSGHRLRPPLVCTRCGYPRARNSKLCPECGDVLPAGRSAIGAGLFAASRRYLAIGGLALECVLLITTLRQLQVVAQTEPLWAIALATAALLAATSGLVHGVAWYLTATRRPLDTWVSIVICAVQLLLTSVGLVRCHGLFFGP